MYFSKFLLSDIIEFGVSNGADQKSLCNAIGVALPTPDSFQEKISYELMIRAINIAAQTINDENLGLHLGEQVMLKGTEQVDNIMRNSPTIEEAFANAVNFSKLISDALACSMVKTKNYTTISFEVNPNWAVLESHAVQQIIDMTLVCTAKSIYWLTGQKHAPKEVRLNYSPLKKRNEYYRIFDCTLKFNERVPSIIFHNPTLNQSVPTYNLGLLDFLKKGASEELKKIQSEHPLVMNVKEIVLNKLPQRTNIAEISAALNLSPRTLQRKLQALSTNFKAIEKDILIKLASKFILKGKRNIEEISYLLGFSEASALIRFFKQEMNTTPKKYFKDYIDKSK